MNESSHSLMRSIAPKAVAAIALAAFAFVPVSGHTVANRFLSTLRIAKPKSVVASTPGVPGAGGRQLLSTIAGIIADTTASETMSPDTIAIDASAANAMSGMVIRTISNRSDPTAIRILGEHTVTVHINRDQLQTLLMEGGTSATVSRALNGRPVVLKRPRGARVEYGHCPLPVSNTLQNQIQGPPPPSSDNGNCVMLTQISLASVELPAGLDTSAVMEIALELNGMSPNQARDFRALFDWHAALSLAMTRGTRSYDTVSIGSVKAMRIITASRRDATYFLLWKHDGIAFTLSGFGSAGDAIPLAESVH